jgi:hypothetical protein
VRWLVVVLLLLGVACERAPKSVVKEAEFGVFFGGQVQELKELKKELDPARQRHGFRLTFRAPLERDVPVTWEMSLPMSDKADKKAPRAALVGQATAKAGETVLDIPLGFRMQDPLGVWHAKVSADGRVVIDRDFALVAP